MKRLANRQEIALGGLWKASVMKLGDALTLYRYLYDRRRETLLARGCVAVVIHENAPFVHEGKVVLYEKCRKERRRGWIAHQAEASPWLLWKIPFPPPHFLRSRCHHSRLFLRRSDFFSLSCS